MRRVVIQLDEPIDWVATLTQIRRQGWGTADICFTLNIERERLYSWERKGSKPSFETGRAILKLLHVVKNISPMVASIAA